MYARNDISQLSGYQDKFIRTVKMEKL